jgi:hypothetical protein
VEERLEHQADDRVDDQVDAALAGAPVKAIEVDPTAARPPGPAGPPRPFSIASHQGLIAIHRRSKSIVIHRTWRTRPTGARYSSMSVSPTIDRTRTLRGAISGAVAAAVWGLQQPFDKLAFSSSYDDVELLGKLVTRGDGWLPIGFALHMASGALFGATYATLAPVIPVTPVLRGPLAALAEHLALWPLVAVTDRIHPAREDLPKLAGSRPAFLQAAWRHLLFGFILGEIERRVNAEPEPAPPAPETDFSSNGHGSLVSAVSVHEAP